MESAATKTFAPKTRLSCAGRYACLAARNAQLEMNRALGRARATKPRAGDGFRRVLGGATGDTR